MHSALTDAPAASFTTLLLRATQHATGLMVKVAHFSHRETCSHHKGSFAGHTHGVWQNTGGRKPCFNFRFIVHLHIQLDIKNLAVEYIINFLSLLNSG
jgi:hypothetical protein